MHIENPYPTDTDRHPITFFVSTEDWRYFQQVTGCQRGCAARIAAMFFAKVVNEFKQDNLTTYGPEYNRRITDALQRVQLRAADGDGHLHDDRGATESTEE